MITYGCYGCGEKLLEEDIRREVTLAAQNPEAEPFDAEAHIQALLQGGDSNLSLWCMGCIDREGLR